MSHPGALLVEPYYGGSHKAFIDGLAEHVPGKYRMLTLPARKWKWRMRGSAIHFATELAGSAPGVVPEIDETDGITPLRGPARQPPLVPASDFTPDLIFCSSFLGLSDFKSVAPEPYRSLPSIAYFHENQFAYPLRAEQERDYHFGLTNLTTVLAADIAVFNSCYNLESFVAAIPGFLAKMPDFRPRALPEQILAKSRVIAPPVDFAAIDRALSHAPEQEPDRPLHIVWNHRWEHDKNPDDFFGAMYELAAHGVGFRLSVVGESYDQVPPIFEEARRRLAEHVEEFGFQRQRDDYAKVLVEADVVVSTAANEFFGMSVLEACYAGCYPLLPNRLAYPELFPSEFLYETKRELIERLFALASAPPSRNAARDIAERYGWQTMAPTYAELLAEVAGRQ